jgi:Lon protease-like protein
MTASANHIPDQVLARLPLFPLPNVVLFPGMLLPLQVFEPRYLDLMKHCLETHQMMAIPLLKPGYEEGYDGRPDLYTVAGAGVVSGHRVLDDGRMTVVVRGLERVRLLDELPPDESYRLARAARVQEQGLDLELGEEMVVLQSLLNQLSQAMPQAGLILAQIEEVADNVPQWIDLLAAYIVGDPALRQDVLEEFHVAQRFARLTRIIADIVLQVSGTDVLH